MGLRLRRKAAESAKERLVRLQESRRHPLLKSHAQRSVRDAYIYAITFAALANDEKFTIDEDKILRSIALGIGFDSRCIAAIIAEERAWIEKNCEQRALKDCIRQLPSADVFERFLLDFDEVWSAGSGSKCELRDWHNDFASWLTPAVAGEMKHLLEDRARANREVAKKKRADQKARLRIASQRKFRKVLDEIARDFCECGSASDDKINEVADYLSGLEATNVDFTDLIPDILKRVKARGYREEISDSRNRGDVWRLIAMLVLVYTPKGVRKYKFTPSPNGLLRKACCPNLGDKLEEFVENYLAQS